MSTDSTELTFVRCPSCRSLVPAISTRCRMCGATLEASAAPDAADQEQKKSGRVRQRTMSESNNEISSTALQVRDPEPVEAPRIAAPAAAEPSAEQVNADDPLSAYIEEVDSREDEPAPAKAPEVKPIETKPVEAKPQAIITPPPPPQPAMQNGAAEKNGDAHVEDRVIAAPPPPPAPKASAPAFEDDSDEADPFDAPEETKPAAVAPRVVVETGGRKPGEGRLNFGGDASREEAAPAPRAEPPAQNKAREENNRPKNPPAPQQQPRQEATPPRQEARPNDQRANEIRPIQRPQQNREGGERREQQQQSAPRQPQQNQPPNRGNDQRSQQMRGGDQQGRGDRDQQQSRPRQPEVREERTQSAPPQRSNVAAPTATQTVNGRLFGWFVSYADPAGSAIEIREGKFFLSGRGLKPTDLVIEDKTISAPHALLTVSPAVGVVVQDLMSERGVFVRKKHGEAYKKEEESIALTHGDWVRFGDVEFLISLIVHPGDK